jgi:oligosaccharide repeat unit polymerase
VNFLLWVILPPFVLYLLTVARTTGYFNASSIFAYMQLTMAIGTLPMLDPNIPADTMHAFLIVSTFWIFLVVTSVLAVVAAQRRRLPFTARSIPLPATTGMWILIVVSILVCAAYYAAVGYNVLTQGLSNAVSGADEDVATLRLDAYAGTSYLFPGYVNQFRNVLLPGLTVVVAISMFRDRRLFRWPVSIGLAVLALIYMLGTGQRGAFVTFAIVIVVFIYYANRAAFRRWVPILVIVTVPLFMLSTVALGRARDELAAANGLGEQIAVLFNQIVFRALGSNQLSSLVGFRYIYELPTQNGAEWWHALVGLLPGVSGSDLSNQIFAQLYGSTRGTAPVSIWGSAYYNFGLVGTLLIAGIIALVLHLLTVKVSSIESTNSLQLIGIAGVFTTVGMWAAGDPTYLFNAGIVVYIFLWAWGSRRSRNLQMSAGLPESVSAIQHQVRRAHSPHRNARVPH